MRVTAPPVRVVSAAQAAARDAAAIAEGTPSRALMERAGAAAAAEIARRFPDLLARGVMVYAGPGNNGGDGWVVARALAATGVAVCVAETGEPRDGDAAAERALALPLVRRGDDGAEPLVVDALLGTGARGEPRGAVADAIERIAARAAAGASVVSLDVPSGVDATTGEHGRAVRADLTLTFGTVKRGLLVARSRSGAIALLDIGLGAAGDDDGAPALLTSPWVRQRVPPIAAEAHKGTRGKLVVVGGAPGMAGAAILAGRAALRSGAGMVRLVAAPASIAPVQSALPAALAHAWPAKDDAAEAGIARWADGVVLGPGLGADDAARTLAERVLRSWRGPVLLDADALNVFAGEPDALRALLRGRPALLTPHPAEAARLAGATLSEVLARRFEIAGELAARIGCVVLLKGVPTVIASPKGETLVSAAGSPVLAIAGSGDVLSGIAGTLLMQAGDALVAGACAAHVHGRAGELATLAGARGEVRVRGVDLDDVLAALPRAWMLDEPAPAHPVLAELPATGER